ncbi:methyl-coenzyme M reductase [Acinetobacter sp. WCHAc060007]|uniref:methyl-coenzyme M reductase n=1 Tax=Acinetobacter sp. WCHAc060007 TaxID=2419605 RepID=UPI001D17DE74|nr:methyl-coenzyme M reductase [Acinetobacter sp. WCHAc060007]
MLIPRSQGRTVSKPTLQQHTPMTGLASIGKAVDGVIKAHDEKQQEQELTAKRLELMNNQREAEEAKLKLDDVLTTEMADKVTVLKNDVSNGAKTAENARLEMQDWSKVRYSEIQNELPGHAQKQLQEYWQASTGNQTQGFMALQLRADTQKDSALADRATEIATRYDRKQGAEYLESFLVNSNLPEPEKMVRRNAYQATRDQLDIDDRITTALEGKDTQSLQAILADLNSNKFGYLDGKQIQQNKDRVASRIEALNTQLKAEENKRVSEAGKYLNEYKSNVLTGRAQDKDYEANVAQLVAGTEHEQEFKFLQSQSLNFQKFANKPTSEMQALINAQKAKMKNSPSASAADDEKVLNAYESIYKDKLQTVKDNPNQAVREAGLKVNELGGMLLKTDTAGWIDGAIDNGTSQLALKDANIKLKPISAEDLPEAKKEFDAMSVDQKLSFIGGMINKTKGIKNGASIWGATLGQLGAGNQNYIAAGLAKMNGYGSTAGRPLATSIINGTQILKNKQLVMPKDAELKAAFNAYVGNTVTGTTSNNLYNVFRAVYADTMEARNLQHSKADELPNAEVLKFALASATGGVHQQNGSFTNYAGGKLKDWKVSMPYGMTDDAFENRLDAGYSAISSSTGISESELKTLRLRQSSSRTKSGELQYDLLDERGKPLVVKGVAWRIKMNGVTR